MTVLDLVTRAAAELNVFDAGTVLDPTQSQYILDIANDFLDGLKTEGLSVSQITRQTFVITPGTASYSVGIGATVNIDRPINPDAIVSIGYIDTSIVDPVEILNGAPIGVGPYVGLPMKADTATYPVQWYYDPTVPTGTLRPFPIPTLATLTGVIYAPSLLAEFTALTQTLTLTPGTRRFLRTNLALEIADAYEKQPSALLVEKAREAKANFKRPNQRLDDMTTWPGGHYDIRSDTYR